MKKKGLLLTLLAVATASIGMASCVDSTPTKVLLSYGKLFDSTVGNDAHFALDEVGGFRMSYDALTSMVNAKKSFVLVVMGNEGCTCWSSFKDNMLIRYMRANDTLVHLISYKQLRDREEVYGLQYSNADSSVAVFEDGKVKYQQWAKEGESFHDSYASFSAWMDERVKTPAAKYITKKQLDAMLLPSSGLTGLTVYFSRSTCPDCTKFDSYTLSPYIKENEDLEDFYILDCDVNGIRLVDGQNPNESNAASEQWNAFKTEYGLASSQSNPAGYDTGRVPTIMHVQTNDEGKIPGHIDGMDVFLNDEYEINAGGDMVLTASYFTSERLQSDELYYLNESSVETKVLNGVSLGKNETGLSEYAYYTEKGAELHDPISRAFLDEFIGPMEKGR